ncbi:hypothetical protein XcodCFBP4690_05730 [Xanthomonas codiaei]|uniref:Uncharacterized protein n=1 Tax=Xanthomonas codiaei TaxID=56463 RepID=A0A2S7CV43_9XANT|nr:hypothetical protein XcodCFBP4690_05730 [Xanthomonas codiaei]
MGLLLAIGPMSALRTTSLAPGYVCSRKKRRIRAPDPDPPPNTPGLSPGTRVRQPLCAQLRATVMRQR